MKHRISGYKLNRNSLQRKALFKNLIEALILHEEINTTETKAKAIRGLIEKLITKARKADLPNRRKIMEFLPNIKAVNKLMDEIAPLFKETKGGFTRLSRLGNRRGDDAMMVKIEFVKKTKKEEVKKVKDSKKTLK